MDIPTCFRHNRPGSSSTGFAALRSNTIGSLAQGRGGSGCIFHAMLWNIYGKVLGYGELMSIVTFKYYLMMIQLSIMVIQPTMLRCFWIIWRSSLRQNCDYILAFIFTIKSRELSNLAMVDQHGDQHGDTLRITVWMCCECCVPYRDLFTFVWRLGSEKGIPVAGLIISTSGRLLRSPSSPSSVRQWMAKYTKQPFIYCCHILGKSSCLNHFFGGTQFLDLFLWC